MNATSSRYIYLVRHGETDWNKEQLLQGHTDVPLNEEGKAQAWEVKKSLEAINFSGACSSDLVRAHATCEIILEGRKIEIIKTENLRERFMGPLEKKPVSELQKYINQFPYTTNLTKEIYLSQRFHEEVESCAEVYKRFKNFIDQQIPTYPEDSHILVTTHGGVLRAVLDHLDFSPTRKLIISNCAYLKLQFDDNELSLTNVMEGITFLNP